MTGGPALRAVQRSWVSGFNAWPNRCGLTENGLPAVQEKLLIRFDTEFAYETETEIRSNQLNSADRILGVCDLQIQEIVWAKLARCSFQPKHLAGVQAVFQRSVDKDLVTFRHVLDQLVPQVGDAS